MTEKYADMLHLSRPESPGRVNMSMIDRGAQFSPFAALVGFDAAIAETGRRTEEAVELTDSGIAMVDAKLRQLQTGGAEVTVTHFRQDLRKAGGAYLTSAGRVKRVDPVEKVLLLVDGTCIRFSDILDIDME